MQKPFIATQALNLGNELSLRQCISKFKSQQQIELLLGASKPYVCFVPDQQLAYFASQNGFALGGCVAAHFQNLADFVWIEQMIKEGKEYWLACRVELNRPTIEYIGSSLEPFISMLQAGSEFSQVISSVTHSEITKLTQLFSACKLVKLEQSAVSSMAKNQFELIPLQQLIDKFETKLLWRVKLIIGLAITFLLFVLGVFILIATPWLNTVSVTAPTNTSVTHFALDNTSLTGVISDRIDELLPRTETVTVGTALHFLLASHFDQIYHRLTRTQQDILVSADDYGLKTDTDERVPWLDMPILHDKTAECALEKEHIRANSPFVYDANTHTISIEQAVALFWLKRLMHLCAVANQPLGLLTLVVNTDWMMERFELKLDH